MVTGAGGQYGALRGEREEEKERERGEERQRARVSPELCFTNLCKHKRGVVFEVDETVADSGERAGTTAESALTGLLRCGINSLPASVTRRQVRASHPAVVPHMEVPSETINEQIIGGQASVCQSRE